MGTPLALLSLRGNHPTCHRQSYGAVSFNWDGHRLALSILASASQQADSLASHCERPSSHKPAMPRATRTVGKQRVELDDDLIHKISELIATGVPLKYAAMNCGVTEACVQHWLREAETGISTTGGIELVPRQKAFRLALVSSIEAARGRFVARHTANITKHSENDWKASGWMLAHAPETREQFSEAGRVRIEVEKRLDSITDVLQRELNDADFERVLAAITESVAQAEAA